MPNKLTNISLFRGFGRAFFCFLSFLFCFGCAEVKYCRVNTVEDDEKATGIRYYDSSPFLLLQHDPTGTNWTTQLLYLRDSTKEYQANITCWLAANNSTFTFSNAVLASASVNVDETIVPNAVISALTGVAEQLVGPKKSGGAQIAQTFQWKTNYPTMDVILFKIVKSENGDWGLEGASAPQVQ